MSAAKVGPTTVRKVNAALAARGHAEVLMRGRGYWYFAEGDSSAWPSSSVMVYRITALTVGGWCDERDTLAGIRP